MTSNTASPVPEQFAPPTHIQAPLLPLTPELVTPLVQGLIVHTWYPLGPKQAWVQVSEL